MKKISISSRSFNMSRIRSKNTKPEIKFRKILFQMGYRYRLHSKDITGSPDIVFKSKRKVIFINGCFYTGIQVVNTLQHQNQILFFGKKNLKKM